MHHDYDFLIVGGGMVADSAARALRAQGARGSIAVVGEEPTAPFPRPALSKELWGDPDSTVDGAAFATAEDTGAVLHLGVRATALDTAAQVVTSSDGDTFGYGVLLLATGGHPSLVDGLPPSERVLYFRTLADYQRLRDLAREGRRIAVVGGGYIGSELAGALSEQECAVTLVYPQQVLGERTLPLPLAERFQGAFAEAGVELVPGARVERGRQDGDRVALELSTGATVVADAVVLGLGIRPATAWLGDALDLADDGGILVDEHLRTSARGVFAAGDVASYPDRILGRTRIEHVDNADAMGTVAGRVMAGSFETYDHTPVYYSDVLDHGFEAVGTLDASLETVVDEVDDDGGTIVYYLDDDEVRGVLLFDCEGGLDDARDLLARHRRPADASELVGAIR